MAEEELISELKESHDDLDWLEIGADACLLEISGGGFKAYNGKVKKLFFDEDNYKTKIVLEFPFKASDPDGLKMCIDVSPSNINEGHFTDD